MCVCACVHARVRELVNDSNIKTRDNDIGFIHCTHMTNRIFGETCKCFNYCATPPPLFNCFRHKGSPFFNSVYVYLQLNL